MFVGNLPCAQKMGETVKSEEERVSPDQVKTNNRVFRE